MSCPPVPGPWNLLEARVDLRREGASTFLTPDFSTARPGPAGVLSWDPNVEGVLGGIVAQDTASEHGGERHLDGDELIVTLTGRLTVILLDDEGTVLRSIPLEENRATLVPRGTWHRLLITAPCRYLFFGGGRTEIRRT